MNPDPRFLDIIQRETSDSQSYWPDSFPKTRDQLTKCDSGSRSIDSQLFDTPCYEVSLLGSGRFGDRAMNALSHLSRPRTILPLSRFYIAQESRPTEISIIFGHPEERDFERMRKARLNEVTELVYLICPQSDLKLNTLTLDYRESLILVPADVSVVHINSLVEALCPWGREGLGLWNDPLSFLDMFGGRKTQVYIIETQAQQAEAELISFYKERPRSFVEAEKILIHITVPKGKLDLIPRLQEVDAYALLKRNKGIGWHRSFSVAPDFHNEGTVRLILIPV